MSQNRKQNAEEKKNSHWERKYSHTPNIILLESFLVAFLLLCAKIAQDLTLCELRISDNLNAKRRKKRVTIFVAQQQHIISCVRVYIETRNKKFAWIFVYFFLNKRIDSLDRWQSERRKKMRWEKKPQNEGKKKNLC